MPELPEVETVRRGLEGVLVGAAFAEVVQHREDLRKPLPGGFAKRLTGLRVEALARRAKYLLAHLSNGEVLAMHLGMSGRLTIDEPNGRYGPGAFVHGTTEDAKHDHIVFRMSNGAVIRYNDARRFGLMDLIPEGELDRHALFADLGPEPIGNQFSASHLASRAAGRIVPLKALLLDQHVVAGLGNIYVCEALWRAGLSPWRPAHSLADANRAPTPEAEGLVSAIRSVIADAIAAGGSTLRDYAHADGTLGYFQHAFAVYGRAGEPCQRQACGGEIARSVQANRSSFHCPRCQV